MTQPENNPRPDDPRSMEERKLAIEEKALELELRKLSVEQTKARWNAISTVVPLVVVLCTLAFGAYSLRKTAENNFQTKLVEVAMQDTPVSGQMTFRARVVGAMFPDYLPKKFMQAVTDVENNKFGYIREGAFDGKKLLLELLNQSKNPRVTLKSFKNLFPDRWAHDLDSVVEPVPASGR